MTNTEERTKLFLGLLGEVYQSDVMRQFSFSVHGEMLVLSFLARQSHPVLPSEIGKVTGVRPARVAAILKTLEKKDYISREIDRSDRRKILVEITSDGKVRADEVESSVRDWMQKILEAMGPQESKKLISSMTAFHKAAKGLVKEGDI